MAGSDSAYPRGSGELDRLLASLGRFFEKLAVLGAHAKDREFHGGCSHRRSGAVLKAMARGYPGVCHES
jgi:hypothetical protein